MPSSTDTQTTMLQSHVYRRVWVVSTDSTTLEAVRRVLNPDLGLMLRGVCNDMSELAKSLERDPTPAVIVDIDAQPSRMLHEMAEVITRFPQTRFVAICSQFSNDLILEAMEVGARHFIPKQAMETDLAAVLRRLTPGAAASRDEQRGVIVTVLSAGGGCGATTFAVNLADELAMLSRSPSLVIDMDYAYGSVATYLGLSGDYGIADLQARDGVGMDAQLVTTTSVNYGDRISVLLSPASIDLSRAPQGTTRPVEEVLDACARGYSYTVIDAPRLSVDLTLRLAAESCVVYLVGQMLVKDIRYSRTVRTMLLERGVPSGVVHVVAGRYSKQGPLTLEDVERGMGGAHVDVIHNDYKAASHSINVGELLAKSAPRSTLRGDIQKIAAALHQKCPVSISNPPATWKR